MASPKSLTPLSCNPPLLYLYINEIPSQSSFLQNRQAQHLQSLLMHTDAPDSKLSSWPLMDSLQHMYSDCKCVQRFRGNSQHTSLVAPRSPPASTHHPVWHTTYGERTPRCPRRAQHLRAGFAFPVARAFPPRPRAPHSPTAEPARHPGAVAPWDRRRRCRAGPTRRDAVTEPASPDPTAPTATPAGDSLLPAPPAPCAGPGPSRDRGRSATHRRPCGSAPPRLRPSRAAGGRGKGASPREELLGVGNMAASSRVQVLRLYRALLRESQRFSSYNYRCGDALRGRRARGSPPRRGVPAVLGAGARGSRGLGRSRAVSCSDSGTGTEPGPGSERGEWTLLGPSAGPHCRKSTRGWAVRKKGQDRTGQGLS